MSLRFQSVDTLLASGLITFAVGLVPWMIGGMISLRTKYDVHNRVIRMNFDPKRPIDGEQPNSKEVLDAYFNNPASKWWCRIGYSLCLIGFAVIIIDTQFLRR